MSLSNGSDFLTRLFRSHETVVLSKAPYKTCTFSKGLCDVGEHTHVAINPFLPNSTRRLRKYVAEHRNFLVEFDKLDKEAQIALVTRSGMPFTTAVFSGNKSVHFVIALDMGVSSVKYKEIASKLKKIFPQADKACFEPTRLTRIGRDTQPILELRDTVSIDELERFLSEHAPVSKSRAKKGRTPIKMGVITKKTKDFIDGKASRETAHADSIHAVKNLLEAGIGRNCIIQILCNVRREMMDEYDPQDALAKSQALVEWVENEWHGKGE